MGKRSDFKRRKNDLYLTPFSAVIPLIPHLPEKEFKYAEPCAADGTLVRHLSDATGHRAIATTISDIDPRDAGVEKRNALDLRFGRETELIITNPPWSRPLLHPMISLFASQKPTWLLFDADWIHTKQAVPYLSMCSKIVSIGRVKWIEGSKHTGKDNSCWYLFEKNAKKTEFFPKKW